MKVISRSTSNFDSRTHWWNLVRLTGYTSLARHPQVSAHEMLFDCSTCSCVVNRSNLMLLFLGILRRMMLALRFMMSHSFNESTQGKIASTFPPDVPIFPLCPNHLDFTWFYHNLPVISWHGRTSPRGPTYNRLRRSLCRYFALAPQRSLGWHARAS